jgi:hypothetical protein
MYEWILLFVVMTPVGAAPQAGMPAIQFKTYAACKAVAQKFNGAPRRGAMAQQRLAVCESLGDQKPDEDDEPAPTDPNDG